MLVAAEELGDGVDGCRLLEEVREDGRDLRRVAPHRVLIVLSRSRGRGRRCRCASREPLAEGGAVGLGHRLIEMEAGDGGVHCRVEGGCRIGGLHLLPDELLEVLPAGRVGVKGGHVKGDCRLASAHLNALVDGLVYVLLYGAWLQAMLGGEGEGTASQLLMKLGAEEEAVEVVEEGIAIPILAEAGPKVVEPHVQLAGDGAAASCRDVGGGGGHLECICGTLRKGLKE